SLVSPVVGKHAHAILRRSRDRGPELHSVEGPDAGAEPDDLLVDDAPALVESLHEELNASRGRAETAHNHALDRALALALSRLHADGEELFPSDGDRPQLLAGLRLHRRVQGRTPCAAEDQERDRERLHGSHRSASRICWIFSLGTAIFTPARSTCSSIDTRDTRSLQPRLSASVNSSSARSATRMGTRSSRASSVASVTSLWASRSVKSGGS